MSEQTNEQVSDQKPEWIRLLDEYAWNWPYVRRVIRWVDGGVPIVPGYNKNGVQRLGGEEIVYGRYRWEPCEPPAQQDAAHQQDAAQAEPEQSEAIAEPHPAPVDQPQEASVRDDKVVAAAIYDATHAAARCWRVQERSEALVH